MTNPSKPLAATSKNRTVVWVALLLVSLSLLNLAKNLYFIWSYPEGIPFRSYYEVGLKLAEPMSTFEGDAIRQAWQDLGGLAYLVGSGILYGPWALLKPEDFQWMRMGLAWVDSANLLLASCLVLAWTRSTFAAGATACLWLLFPGFTMNLARGYPEPFMASFFLLSLHAYTAAGRRRSKALYFLSGFLFLYSVVIRVQMLSFFLLGAALLVLLASPRLASSKNRRAALAFFAGWIPVLALHGFVVLTVEDTGQLKDFSFHAFQELYPHGFWLYLDTDGWMGPYSLKEYPFYHALVDASREDPELLSSMKKKWIFTAGYVLSHLGPSTRTVLNNLWRFFARPTNDYKWDFPLPYRAQVVQQGLVSLLGLAGLLCAVRPGVPWPLLGLYVIPMSLLYAAGHIETRYHLPVMTALLMTGGLCLFEGQRHLSSCFRSGPRRAKALVVLGGAIVTACLWWACRHVPQRTLAESLHWLAVFSLAAMVFLVFWLCLRAHGTEERWLPALGLVMAVLGAAAVAVAHGKDTGWHAGRLPLSPGESYAQTIQIDDAGERLIDEAEEVLAVFDLTAPRGHQSCLQIEVAGGRYPGSVLKGTMPRFGLATEAGGRTAADFAQWWALNVPRQDWDRLSGTFEISLAVAPGCSSPGLELGVENFLRDSGRTYEGPSFGEWNRVSVYRLLYDGEYRLPVRRRRDSIRRESHVLEGLERRPFPGDFRIGLLALKPAGAHLEWETRPPGVKKDTAVVFRGESGWEGKAILELGGDPGTALTFPIASSKPFVRVNGALRLSYLPEEAEDRRSVGIYRLDIPKDMIEVGQPIRLSIRTPTWMTTETLFFIVHRVEVVETARSLFSSESQGGGLAWLEGFGRFLDASKNDYPRDRGPWELIGVF